MKNAQLGNFCIKFASIRCHKNLFRASPLLTYIHTETDGQAEFYRHSARNQRPRRQHVYHTSRPICICQVQLLNLHYDSLLLRHYTVSQGKWILLSCKMSDCDCPVTQHYIAEHHSQISRFFTSLHKLTRRHQNTKGNTTTLQWI
jgi:hypothetical protein